MRNRGLRTLSLVLALLALEVLTGEVLEATEIFPTAPETLTLERLRSTTLRLRRRRREGEYVYTEHGSAFGVDLSGFGISAPRYLLTAAHCVLAADGKPHASGELLVELVPPRRVEEGTDTGAVPAKVSPEAATSKASVIDLERLPDDLSRYDGTWAKCVVLAVDRKNDLCLLRCESELAVLSRLEAPKGELEAGAELMVVGCPSGVLPKISPGTLKAKDLPQYDRLWMAEADFDHGNSGGPVFKRETGQFLGVAVAGIPTEEGAFNHRIALFVPRSTVLEFVKLHAPKP